MNDDPVSLDEHRGMAARKATDLRRKLLSVQEEQLLAKKRQEEFEDLLETVPAKSQQEAVIKAKYLVQLYAETREGSDPRRARLIARALEELDQQFNLAANSDL